ncbi:hypothetical protein HK101_010775, partial [Irineochytrium annulatum]
MNLAQAIVVVQHIQEFNNLNAINASITNPAKNITSVIDGDRAITVYEGLFILSQFFQLYLAVDAIINSSKIQLVSQTVFNASVVWYSVLQYTEGAKLTQYATDLQKQVLADNHFIDHRSATAEIAVIVLSFIFFAVWLFVSSKLYSVFGWSIFKELGADVSVRERLKTFQIYVTLLKLDVFFFVCFTIQYAIVVVYANKDAVGYTQTTFFFYSVVSPVLAVIMLITAYYAVLKENRPLMFFNFAAFLGVVGYLAWIAMRINNGSLAGAGFTYQTTKLSLTLFVVITLIMALGTFVVAIMTYLNFGKGLMNA